MYIFDENQPHKEYIYTVFFFLFLKRSTALSSLHTRLEKLVEKDEKHRRRTCIYGTRPQRKPRLSVRERENRLRAAVYTTAGEPPLSSLSRYRYASGFFSLSFDLCTFSTTTSSSPAHRSTSFSLFSARFEIRLRLRQVARARSYRPD